MESTSPCHRAGMNDPIGTSPLLRSFERHLRALTRSDNTIASSLEGARQAERFLAGRGRTLTDARCADLEAFLADLLARRSASTAATRHKVLRVLYRWLEEEDEVDQNPMARVKAPIVPEQPVPIVAEEGLQRLLAACAGKTFDARRDTPIVMFLLDTGARRAELAGLRVADLDLDLDVALVLGKGRRERALPFGRNTAVALDRYLRVRARHKLAGLPPGAARPPAAPHLRPRLAGPGWGRDRPHAAGWLEVSGDARPLRRLGRRCPRSRGPSSALSGRPAMSVIASLPFVLPRT